MMLDMYSLTANLEYDILEFEISTFACLYGNKEHIAYRVDVDEMQA